VIGERLTRVSAYRGTRDGSVARIRIDSLGELSPSWQLGWADRSIVMVDLVHHKALASVGATSDNAGFGRSLGGCPSSSIVDDATYRSIDHVETAMGPSRRTRCSCADVMESLDSPSVPSDADDHTTNTIDLATQEVWMPTTVMTS